MTRFLRFFRPSHQHTAFSATVLLMGAVMLSRVVGYLREAYIAFAFGAGPQTDAYVAAFTLPDWLNYIVAGGAASITFISIYTRFLAEKRDADAQKAFSIIITVMTVVMIVGTMVTEIFTPQFVRWMFNGFSPEQVELCVYLTRILLPAQIFFYVGGVVSADDWILRHYASSGIGDSARLNYAKRLFAVPIAVLGQATGQASLPFFARLFNEKRLSEFAATVNDSVYRVAAASFLATGWMM